jgi:MFS family permease
VALALFGSAPTFALLCLAYVLLQLAANIAQAAFQAFIPDLIPERERGLASGAKNVMTVLGAAVGLIGVRLLDDAGAGLGAELAFLGLLLALCAVLTYRWVSPVPPAGSAADDGTWRRSATPDEIWGWLRMLGPLLDPRSLWRAFAEVLHKHRVFRYAVLAQFFVLLGTYPAQRFLLFFLRDRFGGGAERIASVGLLAGIVLAALAAGVAGELSDRVGRLPVLRASVVLAAVGMAGVAVAPTLPLVAAAGAPLAIGLGTFQAVNWALMSDEIPQGAGARFFGVANVATAGAGALSGLFGPLADALATVSPVAAYPITFVLAAVVALGGLWPLRQVAACGKRRPKSS